MNREQLRKELDQVLHDIGVNLYDDRKLLELQGRREAILKEIQELDDNEMRERNHLTQAGRTGTS